MDYYFSLKTWGDQEFLAFPWFELVLFLQLQEKTPETTKTAAEFTTTPKDPGTRPEKQKLKLKGQQTNFTSDWTHVTNKYNQV